MSEWKKYGLNAEKGKLSKDAQELETVYHIVHAQTCRRILEDEKLRAGIIGDESILRTTRIGVVWLSANYWHNGSIYGSVRFGFNWKKLVRDRNIYWVEAREYNNPAYRLLITERDLGNDKRLQPYDPEADDGPVRRVDGAWYWNGRYTSEFMIDQDIPLSKVASFDFVGHAKCRESRSCNEEENGYQSTGGQVMSFILGNGVHGLDKALVDDGDLTSTANSTLISIYRALRPKSGKFNGVLRKTSSVTAVIRGALALHGSGQRSEAMKLIATIKDEDVFEKGLEAIVRSHFDFAKWKFDDQ
jgi:hypothetical protein